MTVSMKLQNGLIFISTFYTIPSRQRPCLKIRILEPPSLLGGQIFEGHVQKQANRSLSDRHG